MKRVTIKDIAKEAQTSYVTVSHYVNRREQRFSEETASRIEAAIQKLGYIPNRTARQLAQKRSHTIGIVLPQPPQNVPIAALLRDNPYYSEFTVGVQSKAWEYDYDVVTTGVGSPAALFEWIIAYNLDGVILFDSSIATHIAAEADRRNLSLDTVFVELESAEASLHSRVVIDESGSMEEAVSHLISQNHRNIAFATGDYTLSPINSQRIEGYRQALMNHGIPFRQDHIIVDEVSLAGGERIGAQLLPRLQRKDISAVACVADILAAGIYKTLYRAGKRIPDDLSIVGFDDLFIATILEPGLTTVQQNIAQRGSACVQAIDDVYHGKSQSTTTLPTKLIIRGSVSPLSPKPPKP